MIAIKMMLILMGIIVVLCGLIMFWIPFHYIKEIGGVKKYFENVSIISIILVSLSYIVVTIFILLACYFIIAYAIPGAWMDLNN